MKKDLNIDYDISVDNMLDMLMSQETDGFKILEASFFTKKGRNINKNILVRDNGQKREQIFSMKDGRFIFSRFIISF